MSKLNSEVEKLVDLSNLCDFQAVTKEIVAFEKIKKTLYEHLVDLHCMST